MLSASKLCLGRVSLQPAAGQKRAIQNFPADLRRLLPARIFRAHRRRFSKRQETKFRYLPVTSRSLYVFIDFFCFLYWFHFSILLFRFFLFFLLFFFFFFLVNTSDGDSKTRDQLNFRDTSVTALRYQALWTGIQANRYINYSSKLVHRSLLFVVFFPSSVVLFFLSLSLFFLFFLLFSFLYIYSRAGQHVYPGNANSFIAT